MLFFFSFGQCTLEFELPEDFFIRTILVEYLYLMEVIPKGTFCLKHINRKVYKIFNENEIQQEWLKSLPKWLSFVKPGSPVLLLGHFILKDVCVVANCSSLVLTAVLSHHKTLNLCNWGFLLLSGNGGKAQLCILFPKVY